MNACARKLIAFSALLVTSGVLALGLPARSAAQDSDSVTAAVTPIETLGTIFYAADMGFLKAAGLDLKFVTLNSPGAIAAAVAAGAVTIGTAPVSAIAGARAKHIPLIMIAPSGLYLNTAPTTGIIVPAASPIRTAADLNGKTIAIKELSNIGFFSTKLWIDKNGGDSSSIHWIEISDAEDLAALRAGRIDAAVMGEPILDNTLSDAQFRSIAFPFDAIAHRFLIGGYVTTEAYAQAHPEIVRKFAAAIARSAVWANTHHAESAQILAKYLQSPVQPGATRTPYADYLRASDVAPVLDLLLRYHAIAAPMSPKELFSNLVPTK
jgi:NitT/TauT family transport system substrate-binding protein